MGIIISLFTCLNFFFLYYFHIGDEIYSFLQFTRKGGCMTSILLAALGRLPTCTNERCESSHAAAQSFLQGHGGRLPFTGQADHNLCSPGPAWSPEGFGVGGPCGKRAGSWGPLVFLLHRKRKSWLWQQREVATPTHPYAMAVHHA